MGKIKNIKGKKQKVQLKAVQSLRHNYFFKQSELDFQKIETIAKEKKKTNVNGKGSQESDHRDSTLTRQKIHTTSIFHWDT